MTFTLLEIRGYFFGVCVACRRDASSRLLGCCCASLFYNLPLFAGAGGDLDTQEQGEGSSSEVDDREVDGVQHKFRSTVCDGNEATTKVVLERVFARYATHQ